jgi:hypothetical protein
MIGKENPGVHKISGTLGNLADAVAKLEKLGFEPVIEAKFAVTVTTSSKEEMEILRKIVILHDLNIKAG